MALLASSLFSFAFAAVLPWALDFPATTCPTGTLAGAAGGASTAGTVVTLLGHAFCAGLAPAGEYHWEAAGLADTEVPTVEASVDAGVAVEETVPLCVLITTCTSMTTRPSLLVVLIIFAVASKSVPGTSAGTSSINWICRLFAAPGVIDIGVNAYWTAGITVRVKGSPKLVPAGDSVGVPE